MSDEFFMAEEGIEKAGLIPSLAFSASRTELMVFSEITRGKTIARSVIMIEPPINSASANCQPSINHRTIPSSITRLVLANIKTMEAVKSAPLRKIDRDKAEAAYEQDDEMIPRKDALVRVFGRWLPRVFSIALREIKA